MCVELERYRSILLRDNPATVPTGTELKIPKKRRTVRSALLNKLRNGQIMCLSILPLVPTPHFFALQFSIFVPRNCIVCDVATLN